MSTENKQRAKRISIESGSDARIFSGDYATPIRIYVDDTLIFSITDENENPHKQERDSHSQGRESQK